MAFAALLITPGEDRFFADFFAEVFLEAVEAAGFIRAALLVTAF
jgi:hypothetical protein